MRQLCTVLIFSTLLLGACAQPVPLATIPARQIETQKITIGLVQTQIVPGVSSAQVLNYLGSPNIIGNDADGNELWVYDKIASELEAVGSGNAAVATASTRTMIVSIKFDKEKKVQDVRYRQMSY